MSLPVPCSSSLSRVVLLGFMGAGKSTVGVLLASRFGWAFHDADKAIEEQSGLSIAEIFSRRGEHEFRIMEAHTVSALMQHERAVIALGGGAIESASTRSLVGSSPNTRTVFLDAPLETLLGRCQLSPGIRPLLEDRDRIPERYQRRLPYYRNAAITVNTQGLTPDAVVEFLMQRLHEPPSGPHTDAQGGGPAR